MVNINLNIIADNKKSTKIAAVNIFSFEFHVEKGSVVPPQFFQDNGWLLSTMQNFRFG